MPPLVPTVFLQASFRGNLVDLHIVVHIVGTGLVLLRDQIDAGGGGVMPANTNELRLAQLVLHSQCIRRLYS